MYRYSTSFFLIAVSLCFSKSMGNPIDGEILGDYSSLVQYEMPTACKNQTFCFEKGENYPEKLVEEFLTTMPLGLDQTGFRAGFSFRVGDDEDGNADCPANTTFADKPIYYIVDEMGMVRVVIQSPNKFEQLYSTRWCLNPGIIRQDTPHFLSGSRTLKQFQIECVTTYMNLDFMVLVDDVDGPTMKSTYAMGGIPVCCKCRYKRNNYFN